MKCGSLCYATSQGLGILAKAFYDHGVVTDFLIVEHNSRPTHFEWYPDSESVPIRQVYQPKVLDFIKTVDVMLFFETPFAWELIRDCKRLGVKTVLCVMYECEPKELPAEPDLIICPSLLDLHYYPQGKFLPVPVEVPWRLRDKAEIFVHNAGHGGLKGRNGTREVIEAMAYVKSPIKLLLRSQDAKTLLGTLHKIKDDSRIEVDTADLPYENLFRQGDVFLFPEKFNGLSLPLQEARAAGMLVMATNRFPMNTWLPQQPLIEPSGVQRSCISGRCLEFEESIIDPQVIAKKIDEWYGRDIVDYSRAGKYWAEEMSWDNLKPQYLEVLQS